MKKNLIILALALLIALPVFEIAAADLTAPPALLVQANHIDADADGLCDICGGACDNFGTDAQQGFGRGCNRK